MKQKYRAEIYLAAATLIWGATFVIIKEGLKSSSPVLFIGIRFTAAFLIMLLFNLKSFRNASKAMWKHACVLGLLNYVAYAAQTIGLEYTTVAKSSLVTYLFSVLTPPLQYLITGKKPTAGNITGLLIVFAGMMIITSPKAEGINIGDILTLASAFSYAFYIVYIDVYSSAGDAGFLVTVQFLVTGMLGLATAPFTEDMFIIIDSNLVLSIAYLSVLGSCVAIYLINRFQKYTTPTKAVIIYSLEPLFSVLLGIIILNESKSAAKFAGMGLIIGGILVSELWEKAKERKTAERNCHS